MDRVLLFDNDFLGTARRVRERCIREPAYANSIRWQPAFKQLIYRNDTGKLLVTISQNSIGNAITELLGVVVRRVPDAAAYATFEPRLMEQAPDGPRAPDRGRSGRWHRHRRLARRPGLKPDLNPGWPQAPAGARSGCAGAYPPASC